MFPYSGQNMLPYNSYPYSSLGGNYMNTAYSGYPSMNYGYGSQLSSLYNGLGNFGNYGSYSPYSNLGSYPYGNSYPMSNYSQYLNPTPRSYATTPLSYGMY